MSELGAARVDVPEPEKTGGPVLRPLPQDGYEASRTIEFGWSQRIEENRKRQDHLTEVDLVLEMWDSVAHSWGNETLQRLVRYARLEAETERQSERKSF